MSSLHENIKNRRIQLGMSQEELARKLGYKSRSTIAKIESGINDITQSKIIAFAQVLKTTPGNLTNDNPSDYLSQYGIREIKTKRFPMLGEIACGEPIMCNRDYETYIEASADIHADFCLTAKGDSMINARIFDGDVVFIREQPVVEDGEIAAVIIDNEATLKRVYIKPDRVILRAENPMYDDFVFEKEQMNEVRILGKAVAFLSLVR